MGVGVTLAVINDSGSGEAGLALTLLVYAGETPAQEPPLTSYTNYWPGPSSPGEGQGVRLGREGRHGEERVRMGEKEVEKEVESDGGQVGVRRG